jgi:hypothetical protein
MEKDKNGKRKQKIHTVFTSTKYPLWRLRNVGARTAMVGAWLSDNVIFGKLIGGWLGLKLPAVMVEELVKYHKDLLADFKKGNDVTQKYLEKIDTDFAEFKEHADEGMFGSKLAIFIQVIRLYILKGAIGTPFYHAAVQIANTLVDHVKLFGMSFLLALIMPIALHNSVFFLSLIPAAFGIGHLYAAHTHWASMFALDIDTHHYHTQNGIDMFNYNNGETLDDVRDNMRKSDLAPMLTIPLVRIPLLGFGQVHLATTIGSFSVVAGSFCYIGPQFVVFPRKVYDDVIRASIIRRAKIPNEEARGLYTKKTKKV